MANITSAKKYIQNEGARFRSAVSEGLIQALGGSINYLIDTTDGLQSKIQTVSTSGSIGAGDRVAYTVPADKVAILRIAASATFGGSSNSPAVFSITGTGAGTVDIGSIVGSGGVTQKFTSTIVMRAGETIAISSTSGSGSYYVTGLIL